MRTPNSRGFAEARGENWGKIEDSSMGVSRDDGLAVANRGPAKSDGEIHQSDGGENFSASEVSERRTKMNVRLKPTSVKMWQELIEIDRPEWNVVPTSGDDWHWPKQVKESVTR